MWGRGVWEEKKVPTAIKKGLAGFFSFKVRAGRQARRHASQCVGASGVRRGSTHEEKAGTYRQFANRHRLYDRPTLGALPSCYSTSPKVVPLAASTTSPTSATASSH